MPTRLLDVSCESNIRLVTMAPVADSEPYITLSHQWGTAIFKKLTSGTVAEMEQSILIEKLPKTFLDAIAVTRRLKCRYLWIDSLCIIQDSWDDWEKEAGLMSKVYQNGLCNIAATGALDNSDGLYIDRQNSDYMPFDADQWTDGVTLMPLTQRAWSYKNNFFLARRVIHFSRK